MANLSWVLGFATGVRPTEAISWVMGVFLARAALSVPAQPLPDPNRLLQQVFDFPGHRYMWSEHRAYAL